MEHCIASPHWLDVFSSLTPWIQLSVIIACAAMGIVWGYAFTQLFTRRRPVELLHYIAKD